MTQPTNERPSDEVTAKVVCIWKNEKREVVEPNGDRRTSGIWVAEPDGSGIIEFISEDPRTDPDAAQRLLGYLMGYGKVCDEPILSFDCGWEIHDFASCDQVLGHPVAELPTCGEPFRHAVVRLAAQCLGVEGC